MKIIDKKEIPLLQMQRVKIEFPHTGKSTPSHDIIKKEISNLLKTKEELVSVKNINTKYGIGISNIIVNVYKDKKDLEYLEGKKEVKPKKEKTKEEPKQEVEETPKEQPKETQENKEDGKKEKVKE